MHARIWVAAVLLFLTLLGGALWQVAFDFGFYRLEFEKQGVYADFADEASPQEVDEAASALLAYMDGRGALEHPFFNARERAHMADVRRLIGAGRALMVMAIALLGVLIFTHPAIAPRILIAGGGLLLALVAAFALWAPLDFDRLFLVFHRTFFRNDLWLLDPSTDNLIRMVPHGFFVDAAIRVGVITGALAALCLLIGSAWEKSPKCARRKGHKPIFSLWKGKIFKEAASKGLDG